MTSVPFQVGEPSPMPLPGKPVRVSRWMTVHAEYRRTGTGTSMQDELVAYCMITCDLTPGREGYDATPPRFGTSGRHLAEAADGSMRGGRYAYVVASELRRLLHVTGLVDYMADLGWKVTSSNLYSETPFIRFGKGKRGIWFVSAEDRFRCDAGQLAVQLGAPLPDPPAATEPDDRYHRRAIAATTVLARAMASYAHWHNDESPARFRATSAGTEWNRARQSSGAWDTVQHNDPDVVIREREAAHGGYRAGYVHGRLPDGEYVLRDMYRAYPSVMAHHAVPGRHVRTHGSLPVDTPLAGGETAGIIALVRIRTDMPWYPKRGPEGTTYPVGEFWCQLAGPEISEARRRGHLVEIGQADEYEMTWCHQQWAKDVIAGIEAASEAGRPVVAASLKHQSRVVPGKYAQLGWESCTLPGPAGPGPVLREVTDDGTRVTSVTVARDGRLVKTSIRDSSAPYLVAVNAFVTSWCRVYLTRGMQAVGLDHVVLADTDGIVTGDLTGQQESDLISAMSPIEIRVKSVSRIGEVRGPQHYELDGKRVMAGIPRSAVKTGPSSYTAVVPVAITDGIGGSRGKPVPVAKVSYVAPWTTFMGWLCDDGTVVPGELWTCPGQRAHYLPWHETKAAAAGRVLGPVQNPQWTALTGQAEAGRGTCNGGPSCNGIGHAPGQYRIEHGRPARHEPDLRQFLMMTAVQNGCRPELARQWADAVAAGTGTAGTTAAPNPPREGILRRSWRSVVRTYRRE